MNHTTPIQALLFLVPFAVLHADIANPPLAKTGATGEGTCAECHTGTPARGGVVIQFSALSYTPGGVQQIVQVHVNSTNYAATGFELTARLASNEFVQAGHFINQGSPEVSLHVQNGIEYASQNRLSGTTVFTVRWVPPATDAGNVRFYVTAVCGDHTNGRPDGNVYSANYTMPPVSRDLPPGYRWIPITLPGLNTPVVNAVSNDGRLTGSYNFSLAGFVRDAANVVTTFTVPQAATIFPAAINSSGRVVGYYVDSSGKRHGFIREANGTIAPFDVPGAAATELRGINDSGLIVGSYLNASGATLPIQLTTPPDFTPIDPNGLETATGISNNGNLGGAFHAAGLARMANGPAGFFNCISMSVSVNDSGDMTASCGSGNQVAARFFLPPSGRRLDFPSNFPVPPAPFLPTVPIGALNNSGAFPVNSNGLNFLLTPCQASPAALSFRVPYTGGSVSVPITSQFSDCVPNKGSVSPLTPITATQGTPLVATVGASSNTQGSEVSTQYWVAGSIITVTVDPAPCTYALSGIQIGVPSTGAADFPALGGSGLVYVGAPNGCSWTLSGLANWITFPNGASGTGTAPVLYSVAPNNGTSDRNAAIVLGQSRYAVIQAGATFCAYALSPNSLAVPRNGSAGVFTITTGDTCPWSGSVPGWMALSSAAGTGAATINYAVSANPGSLARTGVVTIGGITANVTQDGSAGLPGALRFVALTPCRVVDTRTAGPFLPGRMEGGTSRDIPILLSPCGVPANARAYSLNITVVPPAYLGYVTLFPAGSPRPLASTLNSWNGRVVANATVISAGAGGFVSLFASDATHVVIDVNGYFVSPDSPDGLAYYPVTPCRLTDTRTTTRIAAGSARTVPIITSNCGIPASARAYSLNVTAMPPGYLGFLTLSPTGQPRPLASTLNSWDGQVVPNAALVPAGTNGAIDIYASDDTDVLLDINGYFAPPSNTGLNFYPLNPCRVADTRPLASFGSPLAGIRDFSVLTSGCGAPAEARAYLFNLTAVPFTPLSFATAWATGQPLPPVSNLNSLNSQVVANAAIVQAGTAGAISIFASNLTNLVIDLNGYFAP